MGASDPERAGHRPQPSQDEAWLTADQVLPLSWRPWYLERLHSPRGVAWVWPVIQAACQLPDPASLTPPPLQLDEQQLAMLRRYTSVVDRVLDTSVMNENASVQVSLMSGEVRKTGTRRGRDDRVHLAAAPAARRHRGGVV